MKKKQKLQKFLNSVIKSHGDFEEERKEIENNVKKMLELFENNSEDASERSDFRSLGNDIQKRFNDLYGWHERLIGKMKNKIHHRKDKSSSGSSDTGSEDSSDEDGPNKVREHKIVKQLSLDDNQFVKEQIDSLGKRNAELEAQTISMHAKLEVIQHQTGELEDELHTVQNSFNLFEVENEFLKKEIEKSKEQERTLHLWLSRLQNDNEVFMSEKEKFSNMLLQNDNSIIGLKSDLEKSIGDSEKLRQDNCFLKEELEEKNHNLVNLNEQMVLMSEERENFREAVGELKSANDSLMSEIADLLFHNQDLKTREQTSIQHVSSLNNKLFIMEDDNDALKSEVLTLSTSMHEANKNIKDLAVEFELLKENISNLNDTITDLNHQLKIKDDEYNALALESSESRNLVQQVEGRIMILTDEAERMKSENSMLLSGHVDLKLELEGKNQELMKRKQTLQTTESETNSLREENSLLLFEQENLKLELEDYKHKLSKLKKDFKATEFDRNSLIEEKTGVLSKIKHSGMVIDDLKAQIGQLDGENSLLKLKISNLDLEIQSANLQLTDVKNALVQTELERNSLDEKIRLLRKMNEDGVDMDGLKAQLKEAEVEKSQLQMKMSDLNFEIQSANLHLNDVTNVLVQTESERNSISEEKSDLLIKINEGDMVVHALRTQIEELGSEKSQLQSEMSNRDNEIQSANLQLNDVKTALMQTELERNSLAEEKLNLLRKMQEDEIVIDGLRAQIEKIESEKYQLQLKMSGLDLEIQSTNLQLNDVKNVLVEIQSERNSLIEEKSALLSKINEGAVVVHALKAQIEEAESENFQLQLKMSNLGHEIQSANLHFSDVKITLSRIEVERNSLFDEKCTLLSKMNEDGMVINDLRSRMEQVECEKSQLQQKISNLDLEIQSANLQLTHIKTALLTAEDEKKSLVSGNSVIESELLEAEFMKEKLQAELRELNKKNSTLLSKIDEAEKVTIDFTFERDELIDDNLLLKIKVKELLTKFQSKMVDFDRKLESTSSEMQDLRSKLELAQQEVSHEIQTSIDSFRGDLAEINTAKGNLDEELKKLAGISSENKVLLKEMEDRLRSDKEALVQKYEELLIEHKQLEDSYFVSYAKLESVEKVVDQLEMKEESIQRLEGICAEQKKDIMKLRENYRELSEKLTSNEVGKVDAEKEIQRLEVQIRLSNQKLKITETEFKEKEDNWKRLVEVLKEELGSLNRQVLTWSRTSGALNNECKQIKVVLDTSIITLANDIHEFGSTSLENMEGIRKQLAEYIIELQKMKPWLEAVVREKKKLQEENRKATAGVKYKEGIILKMKGEASENLANLAEKEKELKMLKWMVAESEKNLKDKEREGLDKDEEKREAIRQLCLSIEYHWENHNHLVRQLSLVRRRRGTS